MDTQPWDYWEAGGAKPKGRGAEIVGALETVLKRNPTHPGAIHLYIHAVEASTQPERALPHAERLAALVPGAGHLVHMPAHIYYRVGMYRESLDANKRAIGVDEHYFKTLAVRPAVQGGVLPAQHPLRDGVGADGRRRARRRIDAATKLDASVPAEVVASSSPIMQPVKAAPYTTHAQFSDADTILALPAPADELVLVKAMYHYARAVAFAAQEGRASARSARSTRSRRIEARGRLQAVRGLGRAGQGDRADRAPGRDRPARRRQRRPRRRRQGLRGRDRDRGRLSLHRAAVLVLPGAPVARRRAAAPGPARRRREGVPRFARRACATTAGRLPASPRCTQEGRRATARRRRARRTRGPGSARPAGRIWRGSDDARGDARREPRRSRESAARARTPRPRHERGAPLGFP